MFTETTFIYPEEINNDTLKKHNITSKSEVYTSNKLTLWRDNICFRAVHLNLKIINRSI